MTPKGIQHLVEFLDCPSDFVNDEEYLRTILKEGIKTAGLHLVKIGSHKFKPAGVSIVAIISESHIGIHTYPEHNHISLDIFTLSDALKHQVLIDYFVEKLTPKSVKLLEIERGENLQVCNNTVNLKIS